MKEWRPDGWENPYTNVEFGDWAESLWEAGASAMLETLKEQGLYAEYPEDYIISVQVKPDDKDWAEPFLSRIEQKGWLVFIPEDTREAMG